MDAEFTVELGAEDPTLAVPWQSPDGSVAYVDLHAKPNAIELLPEVLAFPELGTFLRALNAPGSRFATAKCDAWLDTLMDVDDEPYEARMKCASYVDVHFAGQRQSASFAEHEHAAKSLVQQLRSAIDLPARAEIAIRRAYFGESSGFYWTMYLFGYGQDEVSARSSWAAALKVLQQVLIN